MLSDFEVIKSIRGPEFSFHIYSVCKSYNVNSEKRINLTTVQGIRSQYLSVRLKSGYLGSIYWFILSSNFILCFVKVMKTMKFFALQEINYFSQNKKRIGTEYIPSLIG